MILATAILGQAEYRDMTIIGTKTYAKGWLLSPPPANDEFVRRRFGEVADGG